MSSPGKRPGKVDKAMAQRYVDEALVQIDRAGGLHGLNLRQVSRTLGCAHTNTYNYFDSLPDLLWQAVAAALERQIQYSLRPQERVGGREAAFEHFIGTQVDFALEHPGWYRAIWLEALEGPTPEPVLPLLARAGEVLLEQLSLVSPVTLSLAQSLEVADLFHTYLHGALCKAIAGRVQSNDPAAIRRDIILKARRVLRMLVDEPQSQTKGERKPRSLRSPAR
ncbi:MAG: TetR/AcrR family transcriptional regulator [Deltaproteobacteria bacterium]|nr:TetR/AcrR family transcriptional regulator [Deltaproteobacteria bacterium]